MRIFGQLSNLVRYDISLNKKLTVNSSIMFKNSSGTDKTDALSKKSKE